MTWTKEDVTAVDGVASHVRAEQVAEALRAGICPAERSFDRFLPQSLRVVSGRHWTPLEVTMRVAQWLGELGIDTLVDIGSGAGKFCVAVALASRCQVTGIEQRPRLVRASRSLAHRFGVEDRVRIIEGALGQRPVPEADAYYLYNPFGENLFGPDDQLGNDVELSRQRYERDISIVEDLLQRAGVGTHVIKYNGFGGRMPAGYEPVRVDRELPNLLRVWCKTRSAGSATRMESR